MSCARHPPRLRGIAAVALACGCLALVTLAGAGPASSEAAATACGASTFATLAAVDATVVTDIYRNELAGTEVSFDLAQITGAADLRGAVAAGNRAATLKAVSRIVFHPAWHIVRLRVLDAAGQILADVGGPYVIAPVSGVLRSGGRVIGRFVMSVQDDAGETKLETRFVGDPIGIYLKDKLVAERYASFPAAPPGGSDLTLGGVRYHPIRESYDAFPTGTLEEVVLLVTPPVSLTGQPCATVRAGEFGRVAGRAARLAVSLPHHYHGYATTVQIYTGADVFVRQGATQLASSGGAGPAVLPSAGTVGYQGKTWLVFSFEPSPPARVYLLIPPG